MNREQPHEIAIETVVDSIHFYIEKADEWFFNEHHLIVTIDTNTDELSYTYEK